MRLFPPPPKLGPIIVPYIMFKRYTIFFLTEFYFALYRTVKPISKKGDEGIPKLLPQSRSLAGNSPTPLKTSLRPSPKVNLQMLVRGLIIHATDLCEYCYERFPGCKPWYLQHVVDRLVHIDPHRNIFVRSRFKISTFSISPSPRPIEMEEQRVQPKGPDKSHQSYQKQEWCWHPKSATHCGDPESATK